MQHKVFSKHTTHKEKFQPLTCDIVETCFVENAGEKFKTNDSINNNDKHDEQHDVNQGYQGHQDGVDYDL